jgi:hypothetical protein
MGNPDQLRLFEGRDVEAATYTIHGPFEIDRPGLEWHERVFLLVEVEVDEVKFKALSKDDPELLARAHSAQVVRSAVFDDPLEADRILAGLATTLPPGDTR